MWAWFMAAAARPTSRPAKWCWSPAAGPVEALLCIRQGSVTGVKGMAEMAGQFEYGAGDLFPVGRCHRPAAPVTATYTANEDTFCLRLPAARMQELAALSAPFADFLNRRVMQYLELSRKAVQASWASQTAGRAVAGSPPGQPAARGSRWPARPTRRWRRR